MSERRGAAMVKIVYNDLAESWTCSAVMSNATTQAESALK
jgi:hypothetical protein